ncbi:hypothetical protein SARU107417_11405 [Salinibacter ruber]
MLGATRRQQAHHDRRPEQHGADHEVSHREHHVRNDARLTARLVQGQKQGREAEGKLKPHDAKQDPGRAAHRRHRVKVLFRDHEGPENNPNHRKGPGNVQRRIAPRHARAGMSQQGPQHNLQVDERGGGVRPPAQVAGGVGLGQHAVPAAPRVGDEQRHGDQSGEEELRDAGVHHREVQRDPEDTQAPKEALKDDQRDGREAQLPHPGPGVLPPSPGRQRHRERADETRNEAVPVLGEVGRHQPPLLDRIDEVVGAERGGPVRKRHAGADTGHHPTPGEEEDGQEDRTRREPAAPGPIGSTRT